ncbi:hypothetical protein FOL47_003942 [Perkinsus chesapeaki]|uniref:Lactation elevated protein 1 n=1 Tax=Perkinsus chesapeaki TaxID=330153 RepID=A0A7J6M5K6_PERCH|nr:hypothetical protein FOL47_003942 [Perkinsus chesapeaki]
MTSLTTLQYRSLSVASLYGNKVNCGQLLRDSRQELAVKRLEKSAKREYKSPWIRPPVTPVRTVEQPELNSSQVDEYLHRVTAENRRLMREKGIKMYLTKAEKNGKDVAPEWTSQSPGRMLQSPTNAPTQTCEQPKDLRRRSVYLVGSVGRGKTMLMDTFYESIVGDTKLELRHKRKHFFDFMREVHERMRVADREKAPDLTPVEIAANTIADETDLICLDEVSVVDVQDACILPKVLEVLALRGVVMVMTSNSKPRDLFNKGLNRHIFIPPLLKILEQTCVVVDLNEDKIDHQTDYRKTSGTASKWTGSRYYFPASDASVAAEFQADFSGIPGRLVDGPWVFTLPHSTTRKIEGSYFKVEHGEVAAVWCEFDALCEKELGETDYSALADHLQRVNTTLFINNVPIFAELDGLGSGRRFGKLIELLYDKAVAVRILAADSPMAIFSPISGSNDVMDAMIADDKMSPVFWPVVGFLPSTLTQLYHALEIFADTYGDIYQIRTTGMQLIVVSSPKLINKVLKSRPDVYMRSFNKHKIMPFPGMINTEGEVWKRNRRLGAPAFNGKNTDAMVLDMSRISKDLVKQLDSLSTNDGCIAWCATEWLPLCTLDIFCNTVLGTNYGFINPQGSSLGQGSDKVREVFMDFLHGAGYAMQLSAVPWATRDRFPWNLNPVIKKFHSSTRFLYGICDDIINDRRSGQNRGDVEERRDLVGKLLHLDHEDLRGNLITFLLAGSETSATTTSWCLFYFCLYPDAQSKARKQVDQLRRDPESVTDIERMPYVEACVLEALRLQPPVPLLLHECTKDTSLAGFAIPRGTFVATMFHKAMVKEGGTSFRPERWLIADGTAVDRALSRDHYAFGGGPRQCPGQAMGVKESTILLAMLLSHFDDIRPNGDINEVHGRLGATLMPNSLELRMRRR